MYVRYIHVQDCVLFWVHTHRSLSCLSCVYFWASYSAMLLHEWEKGKYISKNKGMYGTHRERFIFCRRFEVCHRLCDAPSVMCGLYDLHTTAACGAEHWEMYCRMKHLCHTAHYSMHWSHHSCDTCVPGTELLSVTLAQILFICLQYWLATQTVITHSDYKCSDSLERGRIKVENHEKGTVAGMHPVQWCLETNMGTDWALPNLTSAI